jgi:hypothetical protein
MQTNKIVKEEIEVITREVDNKKKRRRRRKKGR